MRRQGRCRCRCRSPRAAACGSCGRRRPFAGVQGPCGRASVCAFHRSGSFHRPPHALASSRLRHALLVQPVALAVQLDDLGVGEEAIEDRGGGRDVAEELAPVLRRSVRRDRWSRPFSWRRTKTSSRSSAAVGPSLRMPKSSSTSRSTRVSCCDELRRWPVASASAKSWARSKVLRMSDAVAGADGADRDRDGGVALADARRADQEHARGAGRRSGRWPARTSRARGSFGLKDQSKSLHSLTWMMPACLSRRAKSRSARRASSSSTSSSRNSWCGEAAPSRPAAGGRAGPRPCRRGAGGAAGASSWDS